VLAVPQNVTPLSRALLAYDGSPKAQEALFVAAYLAGRWKISLVVLSVLDSSRVSSRTPENAREYLKMHDVQADYRTEIGPVAEVVIQVAEEEKCDLLLMGGYGYNPVLEMVLGSAVDKVLRESHKPVLICR
jgi:nucleotide-binding universal stress UspA family protein